jgi:hypothetical protein
MPIRIEYHSASMTNKNMNPEQIAEALERVAALKESPDAIRPSEYCDRESFYNPTMFGRGTVGQCKNWLFYTKGNIKWTAKRIGASQFVTNMYITEEFNLAKYDLVRFEKTMLGSMSAVVAVPSVTQDDWVVHNSKPKQENPSVEKEECIPKPPPPPPPRRVEVPKPKNVMFPSESMWPVMVGVVLVVCTCLFFGFVNRTSAPAKSDPMMMFFMQQSDQQRLDRANELEQMRRDRDREQKEREFEREQQRKQHEADLEMRRQQHAAELEQKRQQEKSEREDRLMTMRMFGMGDPSSYFMGGNNPRQIGPSQGLSRGMSQEMAEYVANSPAASSYTLTDVFLYTFFVGVVSLFALWRCSRSICPEVEEDEEPAPRDPQQEQAYYHYMQQQQQQQQWNPRAHVVHRLPYN